MLTVSFIFKSDGIDSNICRIQGCIQISPPPRGGKKSKKKKGKKKGREKRRERGRKRGKNKKEEKKWERKK